jgi:hypothetical protein
VRTGALASRDPRLRKIIKAEVVALGRGRFGVAYEFDDGDKVVEEAASRAAANAAARNGVGDPVPIPGSY